MLLLKHHIIHSALVYVTKNTNLLLKYGKLKINIVKITSTNNINFGIKYLNLRLYSSTAGAGCVYIEKYSSFNNNVFNNKMQNVPLDECCT